MARRAIADIEVAMSNAIFSNAFGKLLRYLSLVLSVSFLLVYAVAAHAQSYTFTILADNRPGSPFENLFVPSLNQRGEVAFAATLRSGGAGIYRWGGTPQQTLGTVFEEAVPNLLIFGVFESPAIDPNGRVIFQLGFNGADTVVAGVPGAAPVVVADPSTAVPPLPNLPNAGTCELARLVSRSTDSTGRVVLSCRGTGGGVFLGNGGSLERITDGSVPVSTAIDPDWRAEVSPNGIVGGFGFDITTGSLRPVLIRDDAAGTSALLFLDLLNGNDILASRADLLGINDSGRIAFSALWNIVGGGPAIFTIDTAGQPVPFIDPRSGVYRSPRMPSITNGGQVAFVDTLRGGLFTGLDPILNKVVSRGNSLPCSPQAGNQLCPSPGNYTVPGFLTSVSDVFFQHPGINSGGQLVFLVEFGHGLQAIVRAEPPNAKPVINNPGDQLIEEGFPLLQQLTASDPDNDIPFTWNITIPSALGLSWDTDGLIFGTPAPNTTDQAFTIVATVTDSRGAISDPVQFVWTVTPGHRTGLIARPNPDTGSIDLVWTNPSPDTAARIEVEVIGEVTVSLGAGATTYRFAGGVQERNYCFRVRGVSAGGLRSPNSNSDCKVFPTLKIENIVTTPTADGVTITWTTSLPANITFTGLSPIAQGATTSVAATNATQTSFRFTATGLAASTAYNLHITAQSIPGQLFAAADAPFTTLAAGGGGGNPSNLNPGVQGPLQARVMGRAIFDESTREVVVNAEITNRSGAPVDNVQIHPSTALESPCIQTIEPCFSGQPTIRRPLLSASPAFIGTLAPGVSTVVRLRFTQAFASAGGIFGNPNGVLILAVNHATPTLASSFFGLPVVLPEAVPDLVLDEMIATPVASGAAVLLSMRVRNIGEGIAVGVRVQTEVTPALRLLSGHGACTGSVGRVLNVSCDLPDLLPGQTARVQYFVVVTASGTIDATSTVSNRTGDRDPNNSSRTASVTVTAPPPSADLRYDVATLEDLVSQARLTFVIRNAGPATATDVRFRFTLGTNVRFQAFEEGDSYCRISHSPGGNVSCGLPDLLPGDVVRVVFTVTLPAGPRPIPVGDALMLSSVPDPTSNVASFEIR